MGSLLRVPSKGERRRCHGYIGPQLPPLACTLSTEMMRLAEDCRWSQLTILLASNGALCSHENQTEGSAGGSLSHVWRETGGKVRTQHRPAPNRTASRSAFSGFGKMSTAGNFRRPQALRAVNRNRGWPR